MSSRRIITEFILLIADDWNGRVCDVLNAVRSAGGELTSFDIRNGVIEGCIQSMDLPRLERLACVRQLVEGTTYVTNRSQAVPDHGLGYGHRGGVQQSTRAHAPKPHRWADVRPPTLRPSACRPRPSTPIRLSARPPALPGYNAPALRRGHLDFSQRLLWQADDRARCARSQRRPAMSLGVRLAYGVVLALGVAIAIRTAMDYENFGCISMVQFLSGWVLAGLATLAACGLCRFPLVRHACTGMGLWLALSPCLLQRSFSGLDMALGLAAFLVAGCAADGSGDA